MAEPTLVNGQITDAVTQANVQVLGDAPSTAIGNLYLAMSHSLAVASQNAVSAQQSLNTLSEAVTARCANLLTNGD